MTIVAILRGVTPEAVTDIADCLVQGGIKTIEVPLNSPDALASIRLLHQRFASKASIGAGTVLTIEQVEAVAQAGGSLVLSPNMNVDVIRRTRQLGLTSIPGVATPTEAFAALDAGATALKLFPADVLGVATLKAWRSVMPADVRIYAVGGIEAGNAAAFLAAGAVGVGVGGWLYKPGRNLDELRKRANELVRSVDGMQASAPDTSSSRPCR
ncbi:MAG: 2-dehydro-3-deoxy-6-phosphogalactonate aldolase [Dokdonella sp.]